MGQNEITAKIREYKELQIFIKQLQDEAEAIKADITAEMDVRQTDTLIVDIFTVRHTTYQSSRFDSTRFKNDHADMYMAYTRTSEAKRFSVA